MKDRAERLYVHPKFKRIIKIMAVENNSNIIKFTKKIAEQTDPFSEFRYRIENENRKNKKKFSII